ncbi:glycosyltransferase [Chitinophaga sp. 30R24]|uniref:glycosyltransferase n=1 Tax=Chitinophaga sp. 30R24 TaxID=3248838 RepID=UPI003B90BBEF
MKVTGFTYMRNSFLYGYPVIESIKSVLPLCDEFIAVVGKSIDGTREAIEAIGSPKIKIIDTEWDPQLTSGGKIFAQQANIGLKAATGDWAFHIQSDEVIHEEDIPEIRQALKDNLDNEQIDGFLFKYLHFVGDYKHIGTTRKWHSQEIRILRNKPEVFSYRDSQGFRKYSSEDAYNNEEKGEKLKVKRLNARIFHYSYCRNPYLLGGKVKKFKSYYNANKSSTQDYYDQSELFDFHSVIDVLSPFTGTHPAVMQELIAKQDWEFKYDASRGSFTPRHKFLYEVEKITGWRIGEYKNYKLVK